VASATGPVVGAVADQQLAGAAAHQRARGFLAGIAGAHDQDAAIGQRLKNAFGQFDGDIGHGDGAALDVGIRADQFGHIERLLKGLV